MQLTKNFKSEEFSCKDGTPVPATLLPNVKELANNLQIIRDYYNKPIVINSGYRTPVYNKKVGGAPASQHLYAMAADIRIAGVTAIQLYKLIEKLIAEKKIHNGGLGLYNSFVHYDIRATPGRWNYSNYKL